MGWKNGTVTFDDGTTYPGEFLINDDGSIYNMKVFKDGTAIKEINVEEFASKLGKTVQEVYPYKVELGKTLYK
ncbi:hypothetical protein CPJCM30710_18450 [Clostridium polyendosporum]|uniref:Uncharacterized protein n=1 Tax=Clostridium polyendosporum TaxID=69208 RepID=A0A919S0I4_9CLOT|nr:hypothetical protein [Clostridium polyendosporum]GIM29179.1 hypothetical protein CPJCM30710_18450 [Clostridium polyendosporum]